MKKYVVETYYTCTFKTVHNLGNLDDVELESVKEFEVGLLEHFESKHKDCLKELKKSGDISDELGSKMNKAIEEFKKSF